MIRAGVIGLGVGEQHALAYQALPGVELRAVCDIDPMHLDGVADRLGVERRFTEWRKITEDPEIDVVSICSWDDAHAEQSISAFQNGKHVMVEKPLCLNRRDAERVLRAQQDSGKRVTSNLILRKWPAFREMRRHLGELGAIEQIAGEYRHDILWKLTNGWRSRMEGYSVTFGGGIHIIDLLRWMVGGEVSRVSSTDYRQASVCELSFENGLRAQAFTTFVGPGFAHRLLIIGANGEAEHKDAARVKKGALIRGFIDAIREDREPEVSARDMFRVMDICFACVEAAEQRRTVTVSYLI